MSVSIPIIAPTPSSHSSSLSVYEQERQKNIEKNKAVLAELGLGDARKQLIETHKKDVVEKIKRRYTKKSFPIETPRRSARIQGKPVRYTEGYGSEDGEDGEGKRLSPGNNILALTASDGVLTPIKRKYSFYDIEDEITSRPKYKNELTTCHFCRKRDRKPKTRCGTCGIKYWVGDCCRTCFEQHFEDEDFDEVMMNKNWVCYCCRKKCPCLECIAGITKGRRYGPRKFKDAPKEDYSTTSPSFGGVVPDQFSLFSPLPLPSFLNYNSNQNTGIPQFNFPVLPQPNFPPSSPPRPSSPTYASQSPFATSPSYSSPSTFSPFPAQSLFASFGNGNGNSNGSSYSGGFPSLQSGFGSMSGSSALSSSSGVSPQNIFGLMSSPLPTLSLPPPLPQPPATPPSSLSHYMTTTPSPSYLAGSYPQRDQSESLGNGAMCGFKMAQVIAQITNAPTTTPGFSFLQPNFNNYNTNSFLNNSTLASINTNPNNNSNSFITSVGVGKKRGRKPKGFNFAFHSAESISSDPMGNDVYDQPAGEVLPPIKIPSKKRGRPQKRDLPALSVEEEAMNMTMPGSEENIDDEFEGDPPTPVLSSPPMTEKKKRGRPKGTSLSKKGSKYGGRNILLSKKRGRKPKPFISSPLPTNPQLPCSPPPPTPSPTSPGQFINDDINDDEFFNSSSSDLLNYEDEMFNEMNEMHEMNEMDDMSEFGMGHSPFDADGMPTNPLSSETEKAGDVNNGELKVRLKVSNSLLSAHKKRGRRPKKSSNNKLKPVKVEGYEKRKYTKRKLSRDAEDTSNIQYRKLRLRHRGHLVPRSASTRPPQASKAFDDHYLL